VTDMLPADAPDCARPVALPPNHRPECEIGQRTPALRLRLWVRLARCILPIATSCSLCECRTNRAEPIHQWLSRQLPDVPHPPLVRPINYVRIAVTVTAVLGVITFFTVAAPYVLPIIQNRNLWAAVSLIAVLLFTSGHMFNHIRKVPYVAADGRGGVSYFAGGFQNQFGLETQIVAAMCRSFSCNHGRSCVLTCLIRWRIGLRDHLSGTQGPTHDGCAHSANRCFRLGGRHSGHVFLPALGVQGKERWLPFLVAAVLELTFDVGPMRFEDDGPLLHPRSWSIDPV